MLDYIDYALAVVTVVIAYRIYTERVKKNKKFSEIKALLYGFTSCIIMLWVFNFITGFIK